MISSMFSALLLLTFSISAGADLTDPYDLSFYQKGAAIGDSYAAGLFAGKRVDYFCSRYDGSYSNLVAKQLGSGNLDFTYPACSGATLSTTKDQASKLSSDQEFIIASAGGNDVGFADVLDKCIYAFDKSGTGCSSMLDKVESKIKSSDFEHNARALIDEAKSKLAPDGMIYYVGYGRFFDVSSHDCDSVTWCLTRDPGCQYLTIDKRTSMNRLVLDVNARLYNIIQTYDHSVVEFVDYDDYIDLVGGRFCMPGMDESYGHSAKRENIFFYEGQTDNPEWSITADRATSSNVYANGSHGYANESNDYADESLNKVYGQMLYNTIMNETGPFIVLVDGNVNNDLKAWVSSAEAQLHPREAVQTSITPISGSAFYPSLTAAASTSVLTTMHWLNSSRVASATYASDKSGSLLGTGSTQGHSQHYASLTTSSASSRPPANKSELSMTHTSASATASTASHLHRPSASQIASLKSGALSSVNVSGNRIPPARSANIGQSHDNVYSSSLRPLLGHTAHSKSIGTVKSSGIPSSKVSRKTVPGYSASQKLLKTALGYARSSQGVMPLGIQVPPYPYSNMTIGGRNSTYADSLGTMTGDLSLGGRVSMQNAANHSSTANTTTSRGTVLANNTHVLVANGDVHAKADLSGIFVRDSIAKLFHPTQYGHLVISSLILYRMAANRARILNVPDFPPEDGQGSGDDWVVPQGQACLGTGTDTWADRDPMVSAVTQFCQDSHNLRTPAHGLSSGVYNVDTLDYVNVSMQWSDVGLHEFACETWLDTVTDGCDLPEKYAANLKHGGQIKYDNGLATGTLQIEPLVVRRIWNKGKRTSGQQCNDVDGNRQYLDRPTLANNIADFCKKLPGLPHGVGYSGTNHIEIYNDGTPDRVELRVEWPTGPRNYEIFEDECNYYMGVIMDGCSLPNDKDNKMNWKHGGSMVDNNGIKYVVGPTNVRPPPPTEPKGNCQAKWVGPAYTWGMWGQGFANSDYGQQSVLEAIKKCSSGQSQWHFDYFPTADPDGTEWKAWGSLPLTIGQGCLGWALGEAGGPKGVYC